MDSTTEMQVRSILKAGYYRQSQGLGGGGWAKIPRDWKKYILSGFQKSSYEGEEELYWEDIEIITAKDDETALKAFANLYHLEMIEGWEISEKVVSYRLVKEKGE